MRAIMSLSDRIVVMRTDARSLRDVAGAVAADPVVIEAISAGGVMALLVLSVYTPVRRRACAAGIDISIPAASIRPDRRQWPRRKTTLLRCDIRIIPAEAGTIRYDRHDIVGCAAGHRKGWLVQVRKDGGCFRT